MVRILKNFEQYYFALKHLRLEQVISRIYLRTKRFLPSSNPNLILVTSVKDSAITEPIANRFIKIDKNEQIEILNKWFNPKKKSWNIKTSNKLWLYNIHYFNWLNVANSDNYHEFFNSLIVKWIDENRDTTQIGWDPYPTSLRIVNWIKWSVKNGYQNQEFERSLASQTQHLSKNLEYHLLCNHLFSNSKALIFSGLFFDGKLAESWLNKGFCILEVEVAEQFFSDGAHFERSPMYHCLILEDLADLLNICNVFSSKVGKHNRRILNKCENTLIKGLCWLKRILHKDGQIPFFNDSTLGVAPSYHDLLEYSQNFVSREKIKELYENYKLTDSGFYRNANGEFNLICNLGPPSPSYNPGHSHSDVGSFELSQSGHRVIVNSGISTYQDKELREYQRSNKAHNTIYINSANSSEIWGLFRFGRRIKCVNYESFADGNTLECIKLKYFGFFKINNGVFHKREWKILENKIIIKDQVDGKNINARASLFFHPNYKLYQKSEKIVVAKFKELAVKLEFSSCDLRIGDTKWFPGFNLELRSQKIDYSLNKNGCEVEITNLTTRI